MGFGALEDFVVVVVDISASTPLNLKRYLLVVAMDVTTKRWPFVSRDGAIFIAFPLLLQTFLTTLHKFRVGKYLYVIANGITKYLVCFINLYVIPPPTSSTPCGLRHSCSFPTLINTLAQIGPSRVHLTSSQTSIMSRKT